MQQTENDYLNQVVQEQAAVECELGARRRAVAKPAGAPLSSKGSDVDLDEEDEAVVARPARGAGYRITGFWRWKTVVVQPNVYVVRTRRGHPEPLHVGMGISFPYNPYTDAFLVVPAVVQTLLINARCVC